MRIDQVIYEKLFNLGNYENERIGLGAAVDYAENHVDTINALKAEVERLGALSAETRGADRDAAYKEYGAKARLERLNADIDAAQDRWNKALAFLKAQGVDTDGLEYSDDIPF